MNHAYRVLWKDSLRAHVAVPESAPVPIAEQSIEVISAESRRWRDGDS